MKKNKLRVDPGGIRLFFPGVYCLVGGVVVTHTKPKKKKIIFFLAGAADVLLLFLLLFIIFTEVKGGFVNFRLKKKTY
jgi:hypothetical protein